MADGLSYLQPPMGELATFLDKPQRPVAAIVRGVGPTHY